MNDCECICRGCLGAKSAGKGRYRYHCDRASCVNTGPDEQDPFAEYEPEKPVLYGEDPLRGTIPWK